MLKRFGDFFKGYEATGPVEYLVVGLGNPGKEYETTRHNAGFLAVDHIAQTRGFDIKKLKFKALCGDCLVAGKRVLFIKPSTFMNKSGEAVTEAMRFYKIPPERLIVIYDDAALPAGKLRIRKSGSDGGQRGMQHIIYLLARDDFARIRVGIGEKPHPDMQLADWVLSRFSKGEMKELATLFEKVDSAVELIVAGNIEKAMAQCN